MPDRRRLPPLDRGHRRRPARRPRPRRPRLVGRRSSDLAPCSRLHPPPLGPARLRPLGSPRALHPRPLRRRPRDDPPQHRPRQVALDRPLLGSRARPPVRRRAPRPPQPADPGLEHRPRRTTTDVPPRVAEILAQHPVRRPLDRPDSTGFADRATALDHARRLNTPRFEPNQECADALLAELRAVPDRAAACRRIAVPTLLIHGAEDLRPPYVTDSLLEALPNAERVVLDGVAHYPWVEDPDGFQKAVRAFIS